MSTNGIDVSVWQGDINWQLVKDSGIGFVMIRSGYGRGGENQIDRNFYRNINGAQQVGLPTGVYHYSYAESVDDAKLEANFCLQIIKGYKLDYPVALDIEADSITRLDRRTKTDICKAFCDTIKAAGYYPIIYTNVNWLQNHLYADELLSMYDLWLAEWGVNKPSYPCGIWQTSNTRRINGISGDVDTDISFRDYPAIIAAGNIPETPGNETQNIIYIVRAGDTLSEIAARYNTTYRELARINGIANPNLIYAGQTLTIPVSNAGNSYFEYTVQPGDTLSEIAARYNTSYPEIAKINNISNPDVIFAGQIIRIPK